MIEVKVEEKFGETHVSGFVDGTLVVLFHEAFRASPVAQWICGTSCCMPSSNFQRISEFVECYAQTLAKARELGAK